mgnify:CR=1 FL=1
MVILLNLLPHREAARRRRREVFQASLGASAVAGLLVAGGLYLWQAHQLASQEARNALLRNEIQRLDSQIRDIATLQTDIAALRDAVRRRRELQQLDVGHSMPVGGNRRESPRFVATLKRQPTQQMHSSTFKCVQLSKHILQQK